MIRRGPCRVAMASGVLALGLGACGVDGPPERQGPAPREVVVTDIDEVETEPDLPRGVLFDYGSPCDRTPCPAVPAR